MVTLPTQTGCLYKYMDNGIHKFTVFDTSNQAVDEFFDHLMRLVKNPIPNEPTPQMRLLDISVGYPSMPYVIKRFNTLRNEYVQLSPPTVNAILHNDNPLHNILRRLITPLSRGGNIKFFAAHEEDLAIRWLLRQARR